MKRLYGKYVMKRTVKEELDPSKKAKNETPYIVPLRKGRGTISAKVAGVPCHGASP